MAHQAAPTASVKLTLRVGVPIDRAFRVLTEKMGAWWPATHHIGKTEFTDVVVEPRVGGRWYERGSDGAECQWGTVIVYEPPKRVVFSWHLQSDWKFDPDMKRASEVCFEFVAEGPETTRLDFEHRHLERHGEGWEKIRDGVKDGWGSVLGHYERLLHETKTDPNALN